MGLLKNMTNAYLKEVAKANKEREAVARRAPASPTVGDAGPDYADPKDYNPLPILTLRAWDYGRGLDPDVNGYGFTAPDGRIWVAHKCGVTRFKELGVLVWDAIGAKYHLEDLADDSFAPGKPLRLVAEPDNPHSENGTAIAVRNWANDRTAGYVAHNRTTRIRNLLRGEDFHVMSLNAHYGWENADPRTKRVVRKAMKYVIFRPGRLLGCDHVPICPPIDEPPKKGARAT